MRSTVKEKIMNTEKWRKSPEENRTSFYFIAIFVIFLLILSTNFYFKVQFQLKLEDVEKRVTKLAVQINLTEEIIDNTTDILNFLSFILLKDGAVKVGRVKRHISSEKTSNKAADRVEKTLHSLRREMFSLNDKLRILLTDPDKGVFHGSAGPPGPPGKPGANGIPGINGRDGFHGPVGRPGPMGRTGPMGPEGAPGKDGLHGRNGVPGFSGRKGEKGSRGSHGRRGLPGMPGTPGRDGQTGRTGLKGDKGDLGVCQCEDDRKEEKKTTEQPVDGHSKDLIYTISGSSTCPTTSNIIYSGEISSIKLEQENGELTGSNPLCIPIYNRHLKRSKKDIPSMMDETKTSQDRNITEVVTTETVFMVTKTSNASSANESTPTEPRLPSTNEVLPTASMNGFVPKYASLMGTRKYVPCAVCEVSGKTSKLMIPGKTFCPKSWFVEYQGYLMNYHHGSRQSEVLCVYDQALGVSPSSDAGIREIISKYMSHIKSSCDSFQCPPYNEDLLKCVVCSK